MTTPGRALLLQHTSEAAFRAQVIQWAKRAGFLVSSMHDSRRQTWGTDRGIPDLILCKPPRVLFLELKRVGGKLSLMQVRWGDALSECAGVEWYCFDPTDEIALKVVLGG